MPDDSTEWIVWRESVKNHLETLVSEQQVIKKQVAITNGRVTALERFEWFSKGAIGVILVLLVPIFLEVIKIWLTK